MSVDQANIMLIVRGGQFGVQLNVDLFPVLCPACKKYFPDLFRHQGSRYGHVDTIQCKCGERISLVDSDNIVEYIKCSTESASVTLEFKDIYSLNDQAFSTVAKGLGYDIYREHSGAVVNLNDLVQAIEQHSGIRAQPKAGKIPLPQAVLKWQDIVNRAGKRKS